MKKIVLFILGLTLLPTLLLTQGCVPAVAVGATAGGILVASDRRTTGTQLDDKTIAARISSGLGEKYGDKAHVNATSYNGIVLLTGEVPDQTAAEDAAYIAKQQERVRAVQNELVIGETSSLSSRSNDSYITSKVKARFVDGDFSPTHVKVVTERGIVYLMGLVSQKEGAEATEIARKTSGVKRVVSIFEYTDK
ncbi:MAG: BON domain-containing protein [Burkholderiales bacterium]|jgi:osmotically-inducible protein OsmY|nr:BON domain-containing protein [Burkholderiales bacterium]